MAEPDNLPDPSPNAQNQAMVAITPALVRTIADKVYHLFLRDLQVERERHRPVATQNNRHQGTTPFQR